MAAGRVGMAAAPIALTGIGLLATVPGVGFWRSGQRERDRLDAIQNSLQGIDEREAEMQGDRSRLESILPEISPAIDELAASATDAKSTNDSRLSSITTLRSTLTAQCASVADAPKKATSPIDNARGSREGSQGHKRTLQRCHNVRRTATDGVQQAGSPRKRGIQQDRRGRQQARRGL